MRTSIDDLEKKEIPEKTVERLALYRRLLRAKSEDGKLTIYSHQIAAAAGLTSAQVRRDLMEVGFLGHPRHGYEIEGLLNKLDSFFDARKGISMVLVGVGNLGRAVLSYFSSKRPHLVVHAAFDNDPAKANRVIHGCRCYPLDQMPRVLADSQATVAVVAVPAAEAQRVADQLVACGVKGLLNFAPARLRVPPEVYVDNLDMTLSIEKVSYFSKTGSKGRKEVQDETAL